jgi:hypothetical protein
MRNELKNDYEMKLLIMKNEYDMKLLIMKNELLEMVLKQRVEPVQLQVPTPSAPPPALQPVLQPQPPAEIKKKVLPLGYVRRAMKNAPVIEQYIDKSNNERYTDGQNPFGTKQFISFDDVECFLAGGVDSGFKNIVSRYTASFGSKKNMPIACIDKRRRRFLIHIKKADNIEWVEDDGCKHISLFIKCIINFLSYEMFNSAKYHNDLGDLTKITGLIDETHPSYCQKKLIDICVELFSITTLVEDYNTEIE